MSKLPLLIIFLPMLALSKPSSTFEVTLKKYQAAKMVSMKVAKTVKSELLGKESSYLGNISLSSGRFRWENEKPEKTILLFNGKSLLNVQFPSEDFKGPVQVAKSKIDGKSKKQTLIASLLSPNLAKSKFKVLSEKKNNGTTDFVVQPEGEDLQIRDLILKIDTKLKQINEISYKDDVGNLTRLEFSNIKFLKKSNPKAFEYKIPKGAQVTNL